MGTFTVWARQDSITANNATLNPIGTNQAPTTELTFTDNNGAGDLNIEYNGGLPDPDTQVIIDGTSYNFTVVLSGTLPSNSQVPASLVGRTVLLLRVTVGGTVREYFYVVGQPPATFAQMNAIGSGAIPLQNVNTTPPPYCFGMGTEIATPSGRRKVETLRAGDCVLTADDRTVTIAWIGMSRYTREEAVASSALRPVHIHANAFGPGCPDRALVVSPQHRIVVQGGACELLFGHSKVFRHGPSPDRNPCKRTRTRGRRGLLPHPAGKPRYPVVEWPFHGKLPAGAAHGRGHGHRRARIA
nr:Hint domain-containing protein [Tabrizicola sp. YIM 78059]